MASNLVLFGKHPAWSDHMFISDDAPVSNYLKRIFYDNSVIPALQGGEGDQRISEEWSFLVYIGEQVFFIVNAVSRDSVGRRLFPLIVAYPLPADIKLESASDQIRELKKELLSFLNEILEEADENLNKWQESVTRKSQSFKSKVAWSSIKPEKADLQLKRDAAVSLMSRLANDNNAIDLKSCSFSEACCFVQLGLKQFKSEPSAMLVLNKEDRGTGLLFSTEGVRFNLKRHLYNNLTPLNVSKNSLHPKVSRLLKSAKEDVISVDKAPSLKLCGSEGPVSRKFIILAASVLLIISILVGLFLGGSKSSSDSKGMAAMESTKQLPVQERWRVNAVAYVEWIQPLISFVNKQPESIPEFDSVAAALEKDLDLFAAVGADRPSMKTAKHPPDYFFSSKNSARLNSVHGNIDQLRVALVAYYKKQFSDELVKELKRQNYPYPSFIEVDFSQQPILPDFGPGVVSQFESLLKSQRILNDLVTSSKAFWNSIIKPLHQICPEHAKFVQRHVQKVITESNDPEQFENQYIALLEVFGYPEFIKLDGVDIDALSENVDWQELTEKEQSVNSLCELVELLEASKKNKVQDNLPLEPIEQKPLAAEALRTMEQASTLNEQVLNSDEQVLNSKKKTLDSSKQVALESSEQILDLGREVALESGKEILNSGETALESGKEVLESVIDLSEWDLFLEAGLEQFQDDRLIAEIKNHSEVIKSKLLDDKSLESTQAFVKFKEQTTKLIDAFMQLDVSAMQNSMDSHSAYFDEVPSLKNLSDYMFAEYTAANIGMGDVESIDKMSQEIDAKVDTYLTILYESFDKLEDSYFSAQTGDSNDELIESIYEITKNPLYVEGMFGSHLEIIKAAVAGDEASIETPQDLTWYAENLASRDVIGSEKMAMIIAGFEALDPSEQTNDLDTTVRSVFDKYVKALRSSKPKEFLTLYQDLSAHLPKRLHTSQDKGFQQIAEHWGRHSQETNAKIPSRERLEATKYSAESNVVKQFYAGLIAEYDGYSAQASGAFPSGIEKSDGIKSFYMSEDRSQLEVEFEGKLEKLTFLAFEVDGEVIFVQQNPLSLQQYIELSNICDFDTEYYLTLQDSFWPRSFEVGIGLGFSPLPEWQFRSREPFTPLNTFNKKTLPAHLNEPAGILQMAKFFGFRLLKPTECETFIRLADKLSAKSLKFSVEDQRNLERFNASQSSVYGAQIAELIAQDAWTGGIDFERGVTGEKQFFDVVGGSAELAYDGTDFYVLGGSWLYEPEKLEQPVRVTEPKRMYMDLGVRFAIDSPTQSYSDLVQKVALQILAESN